MGPDDTVLRQAMEAVERERAHLHAEISAFEEFREAVRLARPQAMADPEHSETTEDLKELYREVVLEGLDHGHIYGDSLEDSLEQELSPSLADVLTSPKPFTQRIKRDLLVETTTAIERREEFLVLIEEERTALEGFGEEIAAIERATDRLPACSPREQVLEDLLEVWEAYDELNDRCGRLLDRRQVQLEEADRSVRIDGERHALFDYLYGDFESSYPVLSRIAEMVTQISSNLGGEARAGQADGLLQR